MRKQKVQIINNPISPLPKILPVAGMIPPMAIPYEEAPIINKIPEKNSEKKIASAAPSLSPFKDYEVHATELSVNECEPELDFPVAPVTDIVSEEEPVETKTEESVPELIPAEKTTQEEETKSVEETLPTSEPEKCVVEEPIPSSEYKEEKVEVEDPVTEEKISDKELCNEPVKEPISTSEPAVEPVKAVVKEEKSVKEPIKKTPRKKEKKPKINLPFPIIDPTPRVRPKPKYDFSKVVFPGEKKDPVKVKMKVVTKIVGTDGVEKK